MILFFLLVILLPLQVAAAPPDLERRFEEAIHLYQAGKDLEAEALFLQIIEADPTLIRPRQFLGLLYARTDRLDLAAETFRQVIALAPNHHGGYYGLGLVLRQKGVLAGAKEAFKKAIERADRHGQAWFQVGQIAEIEKEVKEAVRAYQEVIASDPELPEVAQARRRLKEIGDTPETAERVQALLKQAADLIKEGRPQEAIPLFKRGAELLPEGTAILEILGNMTARLGLLEEAISAFQGAIGRDPSLFGPRLSLGQVYLQARKEAEAIKTYEAILLMNRDETLPEVRQAKEALFNLLDRKEIRESTERGTRLIKEKKWDEALREFQTAIQVGPEDGLTYYNLALFYQQIGLHDEALKTVEAALEIQPDSRALFILLGKIYGEKREPFRSLGAYLKALSLSTGQNDLLFREAQAGLFQAIFLISKVSADLAPLLAGGIQQQAEGKLDAAQTTLERAVAAAPEAPLPYFYLGQIYRDKGEGERALAAFKRVQGAPGFFPSWLALARLAARLKRYRTAAGAYGRILRLPKEEIDALGVTLEEMQEEKRQLDAALQAARSKTRALFSQGERAFAEGRLEEALSHFLFAAEEEPDNPAVLYTLGITYASLKRWQEALSSFEKTLAIDPDHHEARLRLGVVQEGIGMLSAAQRSYQTLLRRSGAEGPLSQETQGRLANVTALLKRYREAERHEKRGLAAFVEPDLDSEQLSLALWDLERAAELRPGLARYAYNVGLLQERIHLRPEEGEPRQADLPIESYRKAIEREEGYLPAYLRLGQLYEWQERRKDAIKTYRRALRRSEENAPLTEEIRKELEALTRRLYGSVGYQVGIDSNFPLSPVPLDDYFTALSAELVYYTVRAPRLDIPIVYSMQTPIYYRLQTYFSNHSLSLAWRHRPLDTFSYAVGGRVDAGISKDEGLSRLLYEGSVSASLAGKIPSSLSFGYTYTRLTFPKQSRFDAEDQRLSLSALHRFGETQEGDLSYALVQRVGQGDLQPVLRIVNGVAQFGTAKDNDFIGHQIGLGYRKWLRPDFHLRGSAGVLLQFFLHPDSAEGEKRQNALLSYGVGAVYQWRPSIRLSIDYQWQQNRSNLGPVLITPNDVLQGRTSALGDYTKRLILGEIHVDF